MGFPSSICLPVTMTTLLLLISADNSFALMNITLFKRHPMLYFSLEDVEELRMKAATTHEKIARDILEAGTALKSRPELYLPPANYTVFASRWNEVYGNNLCGFAMYSFLNPKDHKALELIKKYMDVMASYPDWYVADSYMKDQVPVGHSLTGFATSYDLLYDRLDRTTREKYYYTIKNNTLHLYNMLMKRKFGWTKQYIHNHAASNIVALLLGAFVVGVREPATAYPWIANSKKQLDFAMEILSHITDGSLDEGVAYGSYSSRGFTQYVYLAKRHLNTDHTKNPWLKQHFWFYYNTILPGFQRAVGIGDANHNWFFGPCSQLVFLDNYINRNGYGNWLAAKIRRARPKNKPFAPSGSQRWSMLHTEFLFYDPTIKPQKPPKCRNKKLHIYSDWGVVTYGGGQDMKKGNTFLCFKSGVLNGEAVEDIMYKNIYPGKVNGWKNFNPGHEHPDQNSFIFAPNGRYFITEALYGPKFTFLDNVYSFAPSDTSNCNQPWEGQIGECSKWLRYSLFRKGMRGEILTATTTKDMAFIAGEAAGIYSNSLGLANFFRGLLLLNQEVLVVFDSIKLRPGSKTKLASATFHNMLHRFKQYSHLGYHGAQVRYPEGPYSMFSIGPKGVGLNIRLHEGVQPQYLREGPTNYINVTYSLQKSVTNVVHVFFGPNTIVKSASVLPESSASGIAMKITINGMDHRIDVATVIRSTSRKHTAVKDRINVTGYGGYARVRVGSKDHYFGYQDNPATRPRDWSQKIGVVDVHAAIEGSEVVPATARYSLSSSVECQTDSSFVEYKPSNADQNRFQQRGPRFSLILSAIAVVSLLLIVVAYLKMKIKINRRIKHASRRTILATTILAIIVSVNFVCLDSNGNNTCVTKESRRNLRSLNAADSHLPSFPISPLVFMTSLPATGGELLESLFQSPDEFLLLSTTSSHSNIPVRGLDSQQPDLCLWTIEQNKYSLLPTGWLTSLRTRPVLHFNQLPDSEQSRMMKRQVRQHHNAIVALNDNSGFWSTKLPWIRKVVGMENLQPILLVRDPRSWIHAITNDKDRIRQRRVISTLLSAFGDIRDTCAASGLAFPSYYFHFKRLDAVLQTKLRVVEKLAVIWTISVSNALTNEATDEGQWPLQVVRFEDLIRNPEATAATMFSKLGLPLGIPYMNKLTRLVRSEFFPTLYDGVITPKTPELWKSELSIFEIEKINQICCPLMKTLNYIC